MLPPYPPTHTDTTHTSTHSHFDPPPPNTRSTQDMQLAVLHPRSVMLYRVDATAGVGTGETAYLSLTVLHSHHLPGSAANMVAGRFGGTRGTCGGCTGSVGWWVVLQVVF